MLATTSEGKTYVFSKKENRTHFLCGIREGVITKMSSPKIGEKMEIHFHSLNNQTYQESYWLSYLQTAPVVSIVV